MKKFYFLATIFLISFLSCNSAFVEALSDNYEYKFNLKNFTGNTYLEGNLYIGSKNSLGDFIAIDSIKYLNILSNISPSNQYYNGDELPFTYNISSNGYRYYRIQGEQYVVIPFPIGSVGTLKINEDKILENSDRIGFLFKLSNGFEKYIDGFNLINGINSSGDSNKICVNIDIKDNSIIGNVSSCFR